MKKLMVLGALALALATSNTYGFLDSLLGGGGSSSYEAPQMKAPQLFFDELTEAHLNSYGGNQLTIFVHLATEMKNYRAMYQGSTWEKEKSRVKDYGEKAMKWLNSRGFYDASITLYKQMSDLKVDPQKRTAIVLYLKQAQSKGGKSLT